MSYAIVIDEVRASGEPPFGKLVGYRATVYEVNGYGGEPSVPQLMREDLPSSSFAGTDAAVVVSQAMVRVGKLIKADHAAEEIEATKRRKEYS